MKLTLTVVLGVVQGVKEGVPVFRCHWADAGRLRASACGALRGFARARGRAPKDSVAVGDCVTVELPECVVVGVTMEIM